jgi:hypothetical protein
MKRTIIGLGLAAALAIGAPAVAQDVAEPGPSAEAAKDLGPSPEAAETSSPAEDATEIPATEIPATEIPVTTKSGRPDLYLEMPYDISGFEPEIVMIRGEEHFAGLAPDDPTRLELEAFLRTVGADIEDMVSGYALVSLDEFFAFVVGIRVDGAEPGSLLPAYLPILQASLEDPTTDVAERGGRDVTVVTSVGDQDEYVELYLYDQGDTIWMVQGPADATEAVLEDLPDPLSAG